MTESEQIAAFIAARGVTRVETGANKLGDMTARDWSKAARSTRRINADMRSENAAIAERHIIIDHLGREHVRNGLGEWLS